MKADSGKLKEAKMTMRFECGCGKSMRVAKDELVRAQTTHAGRLGCTPDEVQPFVPCECGKLAHPEGTEVSEPDSQSYKSGASFSAARFVIDEPRE
ncbi:hypothetical protein HY932_01200 [Candidatus Falkowbacteria bacterium]|nr:hypothetical protein [Candidatus Falkowbacteria bacterium]